MYETSPNLNELRQGDVIAGVYLPTFGIQDVRFLHKMDADGKLTPADQAILSVSQQFVAVVSQCCEFNPGKRNSFSLAQLARFSHRPAKSWRVLGFNLAGVVPVKKSSLLRHNIADILEANCIEGHENQYVNVYALRPDGTHLTEPYLVDFTRVFSVRMSEKDRVLMGKVLQLDVQRRREFQQKLGYFYARSAEEDPAE